MKNEKMTPKIRFKGFTDAWEQRKLKDLGKSYSGLSGKTKEDFGHGHARFISYKNIFDNEIISEEIINSIEIDDSQNKVKKGDAFFTISSETPNEVGMSSVLLVDIENTYLNSFCFGFRPNSSLNTLFLAYILRSREFRKNIEILAQGISRYNISKSKAMNINLNIPSEISEQKYIGNLLYKVSKIIDSNERNEKELIKLKKIIGNLLFEREIKIVGINTTWNKRKLGDISEIYRGSSPRPIQDKKWFSSKSNVGWLRISDVTEQSGIITKTGQHLSELGMKKTRVLKNEHLILSIAASVGKPVINKVKIGIHDGFIAFENPKFNIYFMFYLLNNYKNIWNKYGQPGAQVNLNSDIVRSQTFEIPDVETQEKITKILSKIDKLIETSRLKTGQLNLFKKYLMQNMFI